ncbi:MAG: hypothetical protein K2P78_07270 [Gemmataceae bacterium]|nr:hypothetical protein [Gemmataceae bacterium]
MPAAICESESCTRAAVPPTVPLSVSVVPGFASTPVKLLPTVIAVAPAPQVLFPARFSSPPVGE